MRRSARLQTSSGTRSGNDTSVSQFKLPIRLPARSRVRVVPDPVTPVPAAPVDKTNKSTLMHGLDQCSKNDLKRNSKRKKRTDTDDGSKRSRSSDTDLDNHNINLINNDVEGKENSIVKNSDCVNSLTIWPSETADVDYEVQTYQKLREENLKANQQLFASLGFVNIKSMIETPKQKNKPSQRGLILTKEAKEPITTELRRSSRIKRIDPQGTPLPEAVVEDTREHRLPSGPISFKDTLYLNKKDISEMEACFFTSQMNQSKPVEIYQEYSYKKFVSTLQSVNITENLVAKVVPGRVFSLAWHPYSEMLISIAGDKYGHVGLWNVKTQDSSDMVTVFKPHTKPVSHVAISPFLTHKLYSCSYDSTLRCGDFEKCIFDEIFSVPEEQDDLFRNFDFVDSCNTMLVSQYSGNVSLVDIRSPQTDAEHVYQVSKKSLRSVSVNPVQPHYFISAGNDTLINLWDLRFIKPKSAKPIQMLHNHSKSVSSAYFSPTGHKILSSSADNTIILYRVDESMTIELEKSIKHNNNTGRWLTKFQPKWHPIVQDIFVSGSMNRPREIEVFDSKGTLLRALTNEDHLSSVCSLNVFHPNQLCTLVGANASGRLFVFM
ncbi:WD repeat-containing protein 76-like [Biomphalaria glabrata]|uniref:WD repeat-containing protein 76 n=1 Tax=Biomphalaria glabrata TaxID=6526 RepID=A0A9W3B0B7_BIOGL|nr:WD repeat-containing protein 76-like [Biomphalaria glabrata]